MKNENSATIEVYCIDSSYFFLDYSSLSLNEVYKALEKLKTPYKIQISMPVLIDDKPCCLSTLYVENQKVECKLIDITGSSTAVGYEQNPVIEFLLRNTENKTVH